MSRYPRNWEATQPGQLTQTAKVILHTMGCHAQYISWGDLAGGHRLLLEDWLSIGQQVVSQCVVHHLFFLGFIVLFLSPFHRIVVNFVVVVAAVIIYIIVIILYINYLIVLILIHEFYLLSVLLPIPPRWQGE